MVTASYIFNEGKVNAMGKTVDEMLKPFREMAQKYDAVEINPGVFCKDGFYAMDVIDLPLLYIRKHLEYLDALDIWTMEIDGKVEDCKAEMISYARRHSEMLK